MSHNFLIWKLRKYGLLDGIEFNFIHPCGTSFILSESVDQSKTARVTDTRSGRTSQIDKLEDSANGDLTNFSEEKGRALPLGWNNLAH